jgi:hypothetical protein
VSGGLGLVAPSHEAADSVKRSIEEHCGRLTDAIKTQCRHLLTHADEIAQTKVCRML